MRALPLMSMAQEPQTSSRELESYEIGVVRLPSRVTGFSAMSRRQMMTFIDGRQLRANSSQYGAPCGLTCRLTFMMTFFSAISSVPCLPPSLPDGHFAASYLRDRGAIMEISTGS